ncbi:MAG: ArnT family glycosyltransferase [Candidatus Geothermincolia bacterium]
MPEDSASPPLEPERPPFSRRARAFTGAHWHILLLVAVMAVAFALRMYYLSKHVEYTADSYYFLILARSIRDTFTYTVRGVAHTKYLPGYPIFIWLGGFLTGGLERAANLLAVLGATFSVLVTYGIGRELFNKWAGLAAAFIVAFQPTFLKWTVLPMTEGLFTLLFAAGVYLVLTGCKRASPARRTLGAIAGGVCFLVRWEGILFLPLIVVIVIIYFKGSAFKAWEPVVMLVAFGLPMGIYVVRNLIVTGKVTSYVGEFRDYSMKVTFPILKHRAKVYIWNGMSDALFSTLFLVGSVWLLVRKKWKPFLVAVGWFALFAGFHLFWYYAYERFMAPAVPAVGLVIGFMFVDLAGLSWALFKQDGWFARKVLHVPAATPPEGGPSESAPQGNLASATGPGASRMERRGGRASPGRKAWLRVAQVACLVILALVFATMTWHGLARADAVIKENYKAFSDDHGGVRGMKSAAGWLEQHAPGQLVAVDAGPMFTWLYYPGDELLMRPVPWDLPVEQADIAYVEVPRRLYERGVRYLVVGQTEDGLDAELKLFGIVGSNLPFIKEVARWTNHYDFPAPHDLVTVIFEVLPPG